MSNTIADYNKFSQRVFKMFWNFLIKSLISGIVHLFKLIRKAAFFIKIKISLEITGIWENIIKNEINVNCSSAILQEKHY